MKKVVIIVAIIALIGIVGGVLISQFPAKATDATDMLRKEGYDVNTTSNYEQNRAKMYYLFTKDKRDDYGNRVYGPDGKPEQEKVKEIYVETLIEATKGSDYIEVYYFKNASEAKQCYDRIEKAKEKGKIGLKNHIVYVGTAQAILDFTVCKDGPILDISLEKEKEKPEEEGKDANQQEEGAKEAEKEEGAKEAEKEEGAK